MREFRGRVSAERRRIAIVVSRFNEVVSARLLEGALDTLRRHGASEDNIDVYWTPGSWEMTLVVKLLAQKGGYDGILALGAIVRGETPHFDFVAAETAKGLAKTMLDHGTPVAFGVITADTMDQALDRAGGKAGNKGSLAAESLMEVMNLIKEL